MKAFISAQIIFVMLVFHMGLYLGAVTGRIYGWTP